MSDLIQGGSLTRVETPGVVVLSGPERRRAGLESELTRAKLPPVVLPAREDGTQPDPSHGFSSYTDPLTANEAGHPNSGHTPGTPHPATLKRVVAHGKGKNARAETVEFDNPLVEHIGKPYEPDPDVGFVTVQIRTSDLVNAVQAIAVKNGWVLRAHTAPGVEWVRSETAEELMERIDRDMLKLKGLVS